MTEISKRAMVPLPLVLSADLHRDIMKICREKGWSIEQFFLVGFMLIKVCSDANHAGLSVGFCKDSKALDWEIVF